MLNRHNLIISIKILFHLLGRICDDLSWYLWASISTDSLKALSLGALVISATVTILQRTQEQGGLKLLFLQSQVRFIIPWALVTLVIIMHFNIRGCHDYLYEKEQVNENYYLDLSGCWLYCFILFVSNLNYSLMCNIKGDLPALAIFQIILFAQIILNGTVLMSLIKELHEQPKDYAILFFSLMTAWQVLVMDLLFRAAYQEKQKAEKHDQLERMVIQYRQMLDKYQRDEGAGSERAFRTEQDSQLNQQPLQTNRQNDFIRQEINN